MTRSPQAAIAESLALTGSIYAADEMAEEVLKALAAAGYSVVPTAEYQDLEEVRASYEGRLPRGYVVKPDRGKDFYVVWDDRPEAPVWTGTRDEALAEGCPESRLRRAGETGTSALTVPAFYRWDALGFIAEQRGWLPRANLAAYVTAYLEDRKDDARDLLKPFDDETEVRRG